MNMTDAPAANPTAAVAQIRDLPTARRIPTITPIVIASPPRLPGLRQAGGAMAIYGRAGLSLDDVA